MAKKSKSSPAGAGHPAAAFPSGESTLEALLKPWLASFEDEQKAAQIWGGFRALFEWQGLLRFSIDPRQVAPMLAYLVEELPKAPAKDDHQRWAAACFAATLTQAWRAGALFPSQAEDYAEWFRLRLPNPTSPSPSTPTPKPADLEAEMNGRRPPKRITTPPSDEDLALCAKILLSGGIAGEPDKCGFMPWTATDHLALGQAVDEVRNDCRGAFGNKRNRVFKNPAKFEEYDAQLKDSSFDAEWAAIKRRFPAETQGRTSFTRTLMKERHEKGDAIAKFDTEGNRFQAIFDLLCWKYCLWGVEDDRPLLMKPSVSLTPYGTQIFIPAYMSLDGARDLDMAYIAKLHKARGVPRQGGKMSPARQAADRDCVAVAEADAEARRERLRGEKRMAHIRRTLKKPEGMDEAEICRMIKRGKAILDARRKNGKQ